MKVKSVQRAKYVKVARDGGLVWIVGQIRRMGGEAHGLRGERTSTREFIKWN